MRGGRPRRQAMSGAPGTHPDTPWSDMTRRAPRTLSTITEAQTTRRQLLAMATVGGVGVAGVAAAGPARPPQDATRPSPASTSTRSPSSAPPTCTATSTTGTTTRTPSTTTPQHRDIGVAKAATLIKAVRAEVGAANTHHPRRRRHHPGHPARLLLRQDRADHRRHHAPDGHRDERHRLRRRRPRQPRVQLRPRPAAGLPVAVPPPAAQRQHRRLELRRSALPAVHHQDGQDPGPEAAHGSASSASSRPASPSGTRPTSRARPSSPASSSRPRSTSRVSRPPAPTSSSCPATPAPSPRRPTATRCPTPRTPAACWPSRCPASTRSSSATPTSSSTERRHQHHDGQAGAPGRAALLGHAVSRAWTSRSPR